MCFWLLPISGTPIARTTIQAITQEELQQDEIQRMLAAYDKAIDDKLNATETSYSDLRLYREDDIKDDDIEPELMDPNAAALVIDEIESDAYDELLYVEPVLHKDGQMIRARIIGRKRDSNGNPIGNYNHSPALNSHIYLAEFPDGHIQELSANTVIEAVYNQIDIDGFDQQVFHDIVDHRYDSLTLSKI